MKEKNILPKRKSKKNFGKAILSVVSTGFCRAHDKLKKKSLSDQNIIGNFLTVIEQEIKDEIKTLLK